MDRGTSTLRRRSWISLGLGLVLCASPVGCAQLKTQIFGKDNIGELGHVNETNNIYAPNNQPRVLMPSPNSTTTSEISAAPDALLTEVQEAGPVILPAPTPTSGGVALQPPRPIDSNPGVKLASTTAGVPNAAKLLAASEPRTEVKPETIVAQARTALNALTSYEVALHRQERVNGTLLREEDVIVAIHRTPRADRLSWPSGPNQGREALYRADEPGGQMHIKMANPAMPRLSLNPESPIVIKNSRHPVTEAGFDSLIEGLENGVQASAIRYAGVETPTGLDRPSHCLTRSAPNGENWKVYLDLESHLPTLVVAVDPNGDLVERYIFHDIKPNPAELDSQNAFDPVVRWGQPKGLFSRLTRGSADNDLPPASDSTPH